MKFTNLARDGFIALITRVSKAQKTADANTSAVAELGADLQELTARTDSAIQALNEQKLSKAEAETLIAEAIAAHDGSAESHPDNLMIVRRQEG